MASPPPSGLLGSGAGCNLTRSGVWLKEGRERSRVGDHMFPTSPSGALSRWAAQGCGCCVFSPGQPEGGDGPGKARGQHNWGRHLGHGEGGQAGTRAGPPLCHRSSSDHSTAPSSSSTTHVHRHLLRAGDQVRACENNKSQHGPAAGDRL